MIFTLETLPSLPFVLAGSLLFSFLLFLFSGRFASEKANKEPYSLLRDFPFEIFPKENKKESNILKVMYLIYAVIGLGLVYLFASSFFVLPSPLTSLGLVAALVLLARAIVSFALILLPAYYHKAHIKLDALGYSLSVVSAIVSGLFIVRINSQPIGVSSVFGFVAEALGLILALSMLSPRFKDWVNYSAKEENGEILVSRPRFFILAAGEWFLYLMNVAVDVILYISIGLYILGL